MQSKSPGALYAELGEVLCAAGRYDEAAEVLRKALGEEATDVPRAQTYLQLFEAYRALDRPGDALEALAEAVSIEPGTFERAREYFSTDPQSGRPRVDLTALSNMLSRMAVEGISDVLVKAASYADAEKVLRSMTDAWPDDAEAWARLGSVLVEQGKYAEAVAAYQRTIDLDSERADAHRRQGAALALAKRFHEAYEALSRAVTLAPTDGLAYRDRGVVLRELGSFEDSETDLREAVRLDSDSVEAYLELAVTQKARDEKTDASETLAMAAAMLLGRQRAKEAEDLCRQALELNPANRSASICLGSALTQQGRYDEGVAILRDVDNAQPDVLVRGEIARAFLLQGKYERAKEEIDRALELAPDDAAVLTRKGTILNRLGEYEEAVKLLDRSLEGAQTAVGFLEKGTALEALKRTEEALEALKQAVSLDDECLPALARMGDLFLQQGQYADAVSALDAALALAPNETKLHALRGQALFQESEYAEAVVAFDRALEGNSSDIDSIRWRGAALTRSGRPEEAVTALQLAIDLEEARPKKDVSTYSDSSASPDSDLSGYTYSELGEALRLVNRHREAVSAFKKALALGHRNAFTYSRLGETLRFLDEYQEAVEYLEEAVKLEPENTWSLSSLGAALMGMQRLRSALARLDESLRLKPDDSWAWTYKAMVLRLSSRWKAALEACDHALEHSPDAPWILAEKGLVLFSQDKPDHYVALELIEKATRLNTSYGWGFAQLGICLFRMARYDEALQAVKRATALDPDLTEAALLTDLLLRRMSLQEGQCVPLATAQASLERAQQYQRIGALQEAVSDFQRAMELKPDMIEAYNGLAWTYASAGDWKGALAPARKAQQIVQKAEVADPLRGAVLDTLGWTLMHLGEIPEATRLLEQAVRLNDEDLEIADHWIACQKAATTSV